jgi:hypothetical protein
LAAGKPFINNFLPNGGDMLRINMAVPATPRNHPKFSNLGLVQAAVLGLTDPAYNTNTNLEFIPNMDGFPNGRRLEDDVTRIELQAVSGIVLAAIGLPYDDYAGGPSPVTPNLLAVLNYNTGVNGNDTALKTSFPYEQTPWAGNCNCAGKEYDNQQPPVLAPSVIRPNANSPQSFVSPSPNPFNESTTIRYVLQSAADVSIEIFDQHGNLVKVLVNGRQQAGIYAIPFYTATLSGGVYFIKAIKNGEVMQTVRIVKQ